jgi:hypothetical protein
MGDTRTSAGGATTPKFPLRHKGRSVAQTRATGATTSLDALKVSPLSPFCRPSKGDAIYQASQGKAAFVALSPLSPASRVCADRR